MSTPLDNFMADYHGMTQEHPFERGTRIHGGGEDFGLSEVRPFNKRIHVSWMQSANPNTKGIGTKMLTDLTGLADKHGVEMQLSPERPKGYRLPGPSTSQLKKWYGKHGFVKDTVDPGRMVRKPRTAQVEEEERDYGRGWMAPDGTFHKMLGWTTHSKWVEKNRALIPDEHYGDLPADLKRFKGASWGPADAVDNMVKHGWVMKRSVGEYPGRTETLFRAVDPGSPKVHALIRDHLKSQGAKKGDIFRVQGMDYDNGDDNTHRVHESVLGEALEGAYLSEPRQDSVQKRLLHFDIMHPEHGKIGRLSGGVQIVGNDYPRDERGIATSNRKTGGRRSFNIVAVGLDHEAVARIHGVHDYDPNRMFGDDSKRAATQRVKELIPHTIGPAGVKELARQLKGKMKVSAVHSYNRTTGMRKRAGHFVANVPPRSIGETARADQLIRDALDEAWFPAKKSVQKSLDRFRERRKAGWLSPEGTYHQLGPGLSNEDWALATVNTEGSHLDNVREKLAPEHRQSFKHVYAEMMQQGWIQKLDHDQYRAEIPHGSFEQPPWRERVTAHFNKHHPEGKHFEVGVYNPRTKGLQFHYFHRDPMTSEMLPRAEWRARAAAAPERQQSKWQDPMR